MEGWSAGIGTTIMRTGRWAENMLLVAGLAVILNAVAEATKQPFGTPHRGLQSLLRADRSIYQAHDEITVTVGLTNVSQEPIWIDPWPGHWFVRVFDDAFHELAPSTRAVDILRARTTPIPLPPGQSWKMTIKNLRLGEGAATLWAYDSLPSGRYRLGANYVVDPDPQYPELWSGGAMSELVQIDVVGPASSGVPSRPPQE